MQVTYLSIPVKFQFRMKCHGVLTVQSGATEQQFKFSDISLLSVNLSTEKFLMGTDLNVSVGDWGTYSSSFFFKNT